MRLKEFRARKLPTKSVERFSKAMEAYEAAFDRYYHTVLQQIRERNRAKEMDFQIPAHRGKTMDQTSDSDSESEGPDAPVSRGKKGKKGKKSKGGGSGSTLRKGFLN